MGTEGLILLRLNRLCLSVRSIAYNVTWLCAAGDYGSGTFNLPQKPNSSTNAQLTTSAPIAQNQCCAYVAVNLG